MNRNIMFALVGGLVAGFIAGYFVFGGGSKDEAAPVVAASTAPLMPAPSLAGAMPGSMPTNAMPGTMPNAAQGALPTPPSAEVMARIARIEAAVLAEPKNHDAWAALGNEYFDTNQFQKSVDAYAKALALKPADPNVLTDQGVMYQKMGQYDKAIANFQKANKIDPTHVQSIFNIGIVYANNLNKPDEAAKAWNKVITTAPNSEQAAQARQMLSQLKK